MIIVAKSTPFARTSCFFFTKTKNTNKLGIAARASNLPCKLRSLISSKETPKLYAAKYSKYKKAPPKVANKAIKKPIIKSFFKVPKYLIFESYDAQSYQIEQAL